MPHVTPDVADTSGTRLRIETTIERMGSIISTARCIVSPQVVDLPLE